MGNDLQLCPLFGIEPTTTTTRDVVIKPFLSKKTCAADWWQWNKKCILHSTWENETMTQAKFFLPRFQTHTGLINFWDFQRFQSKCVVSKEHLGHAFVSLSRRYLHKKLTDENHDKKMSSFDTITLLNIKPLMLLLSRRHHKPGHLDEGTNPAAAAADN